MPINIKISVVIPFHGYLPDLQKCLKGLQKQEFNLPYEIIVVESVNNPEIKQLMNSYPNVKFISMGFLAYPGKARNFGVKNSSADILAFIDGDCVPSINWLSEIYSSLISGNEIVIGPIINLYPFHPFASIDNLLQFPDFQKHRSAKNITHFPACNLGMTRKLFCKTNGFPEDISAGEDIKFSQSVLSICGGKIFYNVKLIVKHSGRKGLKSFVEHNKSLGFHRGYLSLKIPDKKGKFKGTLLSASVFGVKRLIYITIRTLQWNPVSLLRIIFFLPFLILGLAAWGAGFRQGSKKYMSGKNEL